VEYSNILRRQFFPLRRRTSPASQKHSVAHPPTVEFMERSMTDKGFREAGRRLKAAMISYQMGYKGVDSTLRQVPEDPGDSWTEMAEHILRGMTAAVAESVLGPPRKGPDSIQ
jgi:hypothetical protein